MQDVLLKVATALPSGAATTTSTALDLQSGGKYTAGKASLVFNVPATPTLANTKTLTCAILHCDTVGGSYVAPDGMGPIVITGPASGGGVATRYPYPLPENLKRFVKATYTGVASGGDLSAVSATLALEYP